MISTAVNRSRSAMSPKLVNPKRLRKTMIKTKTTSHRRSSSNRLRRKGRYTSSGKTPERFFSVPRYSPSDFLPYRCKVFVKKDGNFSDRGVGTLFLKPTPNEKTQLIVRADTSCGNLLLNTILNDTIPTQRMGKNNVMMVLLPTPESKPPPTPILLRVKTSEDADALLEVLDKHKK